MRLQAGTRHEAISPGPPAAPPATPPVGPLPPSAPPPDGAAAAGRPRAGGHWPGCRCRPRPRAFTCSPGHAVTAARNEISERRHLLPPHTSPPGLCVVVNSLSRPRSAELQLVALPPQARSRPRPPPAAPPGGPALPSVSSTNPPGRPPVARPPPTMSSQVLQPRHPLHFDSWPRPERNRKASFLFCLPLCSSSPRCPFPAAPQAP